MKKIITLCIFCFIFSSSFSQVGQWTWMSGDDSIQSVGHYGIQGVPDTANYPPAVYEPCDWQDQQGNFWVFGGFCSAHNSDMADLWKYNPLTNEWTWMKGIGAITNGSDTGSYGTMGIASPLNRPCGRGWGTPSWSDNNGNLWLYGGDNNSADLWKYNINTNEWTWMQGTPWNFWWNPTQTNYGTFQVPSSTNTPGTREETAASWTDANGNLWLFGGNSWDTITNSSTFNNDMWKYDVSINQWVWMNGPNYPNDTGYYGIKGVASQLNRPSARDAYAKWKDSSGNFYLFGGVSFGTCGFEGFNDVWKYDIGLNNWIWIGGDSTINDAGSYAGECATLNSNIPGNAFENRSTCFDSLGNVFMFGSLGCLCSTFSTNTNEFFHYSIQHNEWTLIMQNSPVVWGTKGIPSASNAPPKTSGSVAWYRNNEVWIFGGTANADNADNYNCLWRFTIDSSCFPTGIEEKNFIYKLTIFPNPTQNELTITGNPLSEKSKIEIVDVAGRNVLESEIANPESQIKIDVSNFVNGIYFVKITTYAGSVVKKFVVQH
jgi:hypothetical protein